MGVHNARTLMRTYRGAPESLTRVLTAWSADPRLPRVTRREIVGLLRTLAPPPRPNVGIVPFPVVDVATGEGRIYRVLAADGVRGDWTPLPHATSSRIHDWLCRSWPELGTSWPVLHVSGPPPGDAWSGTSCEAALVVAALSWSLGIAPEPFVLTGALGEPGRVQAVDHVDAKRSIAEADLPGHPLLAPTGSVDALLDQVLPGWRQVTQRTASQTASRRSHDAVAALSTHRHNEALSLAESALEHADDDASIARARWVRGAVRLHQGRAAEGMADLSEARARLPGWTDHDDDPPDDLTAEELAAWEIVALIDSGHPAAAADLGQRTLGLLDAARSRARRWRSVALQVAGSTHRALVTLDDAPAAEQILRAWSLGSAALVDQRARVLGDLAEVQRRMHHAAGARHSLRAARRALRDADDSSGLTSRFLDLFEARLDADDGHPPQHVPTEGIWPTLGVAVLASRSGADLASLHALPAVRASAALQWVVASEIAWHALRGGPQAHLLPLLQADVAGWSFDQSATCAWQQRLVRAPTSDDLRSLRRRAPYG